MTEPPPLPLAGGCLCGAVRYALTATPAHATLCHCEDCRRAAGAPVVAWFTVPRAGFDFVRGTPQSFRSSPQVMRRFCGTCGTALTFEHDGLPDEVDVTTASLDRPQDVPPRDHTYVARRLPWLVPGDGLPRYARGHDEPPIDAEPRGPGSRDEPGP